ncbi:hypothetical protein OAQ57_02185 [Candidatus Marinimicrobia bacterium]|nr:hypothetical protein [Candidatus Neomarinimicrobiota bacterium]
MSKIENTLALIKDEFSIFSDPRDKYVYLVDLAKDMKGLNEVRGKPISSADIQEASNKLIG